ncbi:MAG: helix-turn-helix transcriptional regulator [Solirubrobacterales bacterium]|nr:helix-turn-helix transcriptional regulator [Solirubrobacterales bacterium]
MSAARTDRVFSALADPNRRRIVEHLAGAGPATATTLAARLGVSRQGAAKHLSSLSEAGIVSPSRQGREVLYELRDQGLAPGVDWLGRIDGEWERRLGSLKRHLDG